MILSVLIIFVIVSIYVYVSFNDKSQVQKEKCIYTISYTPCTAICDGGTRVQSTVLSADSSQTCESFDDNTVACNIEPCPVSDNVDDMNDYILMGGDSNSCYMYPYWRLNWDVERARTDPNYMDVYSQIKSICSTKDSRNACLSTGKLPSFIDDTTRVICTWLY